MTPTRLRCEYLENPLAIDAPRPRLSWELEADRRGAAQTAYRILVASTAEKLAADEGDLWDSGQVNSDETIQVVYDGKPLATRQRAFWKVRVWDENGRPTEWGGPACWRMGFMTPADVKAEWIGKADPPPADKELESLPPTMLRKEFKAAKPIANATLYASALGLYEARINGQRVGDRLLTPEWTSYHKHVQYQAYDVTDMLEQGENAIGGWLADGWYAGRIGISHIAGKPEKLRAWYGDHPHLFVQLEIEYTDGSTETIISDGSWKSTTDGPIRKACILDGEVYDMRQAMPGWDSPGFDDAGWKGVHVLDGIEAEIVAQPGPPVRVTETLKPVAVNEPSPGAYVVDFGQNIAGFCRITVNGPEGATVRLRHAEVLEEDGNIYRDNLRMQAHARINPELGARQEDEIILDGSGPFTFEPRFVYHGFRYVEVVGMDRAPTADDIVAEAFHTDCPMAGAFECSSDLLNKLMRNIVWTHRDNMHSVPTDCPQRDERCGWMGDMLVFAQPAVFNMDMAAFFTKWMRDIRDDQTADGRFPDIAPHPFDPEARFSGVPSWGDCGVVVPWVQYVNYGDKRMLEEYFESMKEWIDWIHGNNPNLLWENERNNDYGDWLNGNTLALRDFGYPAEGAEVPKDVHATAFWQHSTELLSKMAAIIGREDEAKKYGKLAEDIRAAFVKAYIDEDGRIKGHCQAGYAEALNFDLVPEALQEKAAKHMVQRIEDYKWHISTGFHTTIMLMNQLTRFGRGDVAYRLINNKTMPSWGYTIEHGGTTIWERWDGWVEGRGYQTPNMNSFNHYAIGAVGEWMYRSILGINPDESKPGYEHILIKPVPGGGLTYAKGHYDSIRGRIATSWKLDGETLTLEVTIPANTTATVEVPASNADAVTESGQAAKQAEGVTFAGKQPGVAVFEVKSGTYRFQSTIAP